MALASYPVPHGVRALVGVRIWRVLAGASARGRHRPGGCRGRRIAHPRPACEDGGEHATCARRSPSRASSLRPTKRVPLGTIFGARSGDKGGNANVGIWARSGAGYAWLADCLTVERFKDLVSEARDLAVRRYELPNIRSLNFVVVGMLGEGVSSSTRADP